MIKKFAGVTVGVTAGLLAVAPMASASEGHDDSGDQHGTGNIQCEGEGGDASTENEGGTVQAGAILSGNGGQLLSCNSFLNDFLNDNLNDNELNIASPPLLSDRAVKRDVVPVDWSR